MTAPAAVVFDYGGVLTFDPFAGLKELEAEHGLEPGALCADFRGGEHFARAEVGAVPLRQFFADWLASVERRHGLVLEARATAAALRAGGEVDPAAVALVRALAAAGVRLGVLTNNVAESRDHWQGQLPMELIDVVVDSSAVGLRKPDPRIYDVLVERLACPPAAVVFVDDFEENLAPAAALGMRTIHFTSVDACAAELRAAGLPV